MPQQNYFLTNRWKIKGGPELLQEAVYPRNRAVRKPLSDSEKNY